MKFGSIQRRLSAQEAANFEQMWIDGASYAEIAERFRMSIDAVRARARIYKLPKRPRVVHRHVWNNEMDDFVRSEYAKGTPYRDVAAALGVSDSALNSHIFYIKIKPNRRAKFKKTRKAKKK